MELNYISCIYDNIHIYVWQKNKRCINKSFQAPISIKKNIVINGKQIFAITYCIFLYLSEIENINIRAIKLLGPNIFL